MLFTGLFILLVALPAISRAELCEYVMSKDCAFIADDVRVCGTNGVTYRNACFLAKAYCHDNSIHKAHDLECPTTTTSTTMATTTTTQPETTTTMMTTTTMALTTTTVNGMDLVLDIFCLDLNYITCSTEGPEVCDDLGDTHINICEFDKTRCYHRDLLQVPCYK